MPIAKNTGLKKKLIVITVSLEERLKEYMKVEKSRRNESEIIRLALDTYLRGKGM